jgi:hemerythrin-like domain-containing protein
MDPVQMLKDDHKKVKQLFKQFEKADDGKKMEIAKEVFRELEVHSKVEEEIFYPAYKQKADEEGKETTNEAVEEHHVVDVLIKEMKAMKKVDETFEAKFTVLTENVEHHIEEEEQEMLPDAKKLLKDQSDELAQKMEKRKKEMMAAR